MTNIKMDFDKETANRLLNEAFDIISDIRDIINDDELDEEDTYEKIEYIMRRVK